MGAVKITSIDSHVVDIFGSTKGRDQPVMLMEKALLLVDQLGEAIFEDPDTVFFDPFCKAGEILLGTAIKLCLSKNKKVKPTFTEKEISNVIYQSNRFFALAPDERHYLLSLRTFYGNEKSHDAKFTKYIKNGSYLSEADGRLQLEKFEQEFNNMIEFIKKTKTNARIIAIGNPPYQESDGGFGKSAKSIYNFFTEHLVASESISEFILVIPARWFGGGKGLDGFRNNLMKSKKIKKLTYFQNSSHVFPTVDINGGICFLHYDKSHNGKTTFTDGKYTEILHLDEFDIIADDPLGYSLVRKVMKNWTGKVISDVAMSRKAFGISTNYFDENISPDPKKVDCFPCLNKGREIKYISKNEVLKNIDKINLWKVAVPKAAGGSKGKRRSTIPLNQIFLIEKGVITTETYNIIDTFQTKKEAEALIKFLKTDFSRYLLGLRKITQDLPADRWAWVPYVDVSKDWTDDELFKYFKITKDEQEHIKSKVQEWS